MRNGDWIDPLNAFRPGICGFRGEPVKEFCVRDQSVSPAAQWVGVGRGELDECFLPVRDDPALDDDSAELEVQRLHPVGVALG